MRQYTIFDGIFVTLFRFHISFIDITALGYWRFISFDNGDELRSFITLLRLFDTARFIEH